MTAFCLSPLLVKRKAQRFAEGGICANFAPCMNNDNILYSQPVLDFVTVSTEYCKYLEQLEGTEQRDFCHVMLALLPMIYLKATMIKNAPEAEGWNEKQLTEADYDFVRSKVAQVMGANDDFLDVFVEDFKFSEQPVLCTISENLADIYQQLRELVETFRNGYEDAMEVELSEVLEEFRMQWGQKLLNALRALHDANYQNI